MPIVVGRLDRLEWFFAMDELQRLEFEADASYAMRQGLLALVAAKGPDAAAALSRPVLQIGIHHDVEVNLLDRGKVSKAYSQGVPPEYDDWTMDALYETYR